jgi:hypothetical protein
MLRFNVPGSRRPLFAAALAVLVSACDRNPYDPAQQPRVTVTPADGGATVAIEWEPEGAQLIRVYRGPTAGDGYTDQLMWSVAATSRNSLTSGIRYGAAPSGGTTDVAATSLVTGEVYTVQVTRQDPTGSGDGFTNTSNRYIGTARFTR